MVEAALDQHLGDQLHRDVAAPAHLGCGSNVSATRLGWVNPKENHQLRIRSKSMVHVRAVKIFRGAQLELESRG